MNEQEEEQGRLADWELRPARDLDLPLGERLRSLSRERGLLDTMAGFVWWGMVRGYMRLYHRLTIDGHEHLPGKAPFVMVANHSSHLDTLALGSILPRHLRHCVYPLAAGDTFFESPATATFAALILNALPMWRRKAGRHAMEQLRERLSAEPPSGYILFPEGTRSRSGEMASFKPGLGMLVAGTRVPVIPCYLTGTFQALPPERRLPRPRRLRLRVGPSLSFAGTAHDREGWQRIATETRTAVRALMPPGNPQQPREPPA